MLDLDRIALDHVPCDYCHATPGARCVTKTGARSSRNHSRRTQAVYDGWRIGYFEGLEAALDTIERARANGHSLAQVEAQLRPWLRH